jgi:DNA polymerase III delta prime subunit
MSIYDVHFEQYLKAHDKKSLHPKLNSVIKSMPNKIEDLNNLILYGPPGVGKYTQALNIVKLYSKSKLKYEKKLSVAVGKTTYCIKISDVHFEIDMSLLGCNAKTLWHSIYTQILDVLYSRPDKHGIIICKYFHTIHSELLESFYGYMQSDISSQAKLSFILLTEHVTFIPSVILDRSFTISIPRPTRAAYNKILPDNLPKSLKIDDITNIKDLTVNLDHAKNSFEMITNKLVNHLLDLDTLHMGHLRDTLYDLFIYNFDVQKCILNVIIILISMNRIPEDSIDCLFTELYRFLKYYNNNYRPIYHLERICIYLITVIHDISESS